MGQRHIGKVISGIITIFWMAVIFAFSAQPAQQSSQVSDGVAYRIAEWQSDLFHLERTQGELAVQAEAMQLIIRKGAHMGEYALLAFLLCLHFRYYKFIVKKIPHTPSGAARFFSGISRFPAIRQIVLPALIITTGYAATDEFHQLFVPGRAGRLTDVCIDSLGGIGGIIFYLILRRCLPPLFQHFHIKVHHAKGKR